MSRSTTAAITALVLGALVLSSCSSSKHAQPAPSGSASPTATASVSFDGVTVVGATDLASKPKVSSASSAKPAVLQVKDLVVGDGAAASPTATVTVQYVGVRYADGKQFDASWDHGGATSFNLQQLVPGFTQGVGGTSGIQPMKVGGRRIIVMPASLGYGANGTPDGSIPPNAPIVFVVDLLSLG